MTALCPKLHARGVSRFSEERRGIAAIIRILPSAQVFLPGKTKQNVLFAASGFRTGSPRFRAAESCRSSHRAVCPIQDLQYSS